MLRELTIENFALIDALRLEFGPGFTVLTGETGAGKSIIIDALNAVLGERIGADAIRGGEANAAVEAVFDAADAPLALRNLEEAGLREGTDDTLILSRSISSGRSAYRVNRRASTLGAVHDLSRHLVDIHGQHDHQRLIHEESHLSFLDGYGGPRHRELRAQYEQEFSAFQGAQRALEDLQMGERERAQRVDMLRFQAQEIQAADLQPQEEEALGVERLRLQHAERIREGVLRARDLLDGEAPGELTALAAVQRAAHELRPLVKLDAGLEGTARELDSAGVVLTESVRALSAAAESLEADPERLEQVERRLAEIARLKRKYGDSVEEIIAFGRRVAAELAELENREAREEELRAELEVRRTAAGALAEALSAARDTLARQLQEVVERELGGLGMQAATFQVSLEREDDPEGLPDARGRRHRATRRGVDQGRFLLSANAGELPKPLSKVASGGELSRLMLVLKSTCSRGAEIPTIIFDEVDVGIGGRVAHAVAERLVSVSRGGQVLCVTHLPQIARLADRHIQVAKELSGGRTVVRTRELDQAGRVAELARMLGAAEGDETGRRHAEELLKEAAGVRDKLRKR